jgi:hypothetical protein
MGELMRNSEGRKFSTAFMRSAQSNTGIPLNECLHPQRSYIAIEIKDPKGSRVLDMAMSYDQFVRLLLCSTDIPVTLTGYYDSKGAWVKEEVPVPESVQDRVVNRMGEATSAIQGRITDLRKDLYEALNSGKPVSKKKLEQLLGDVQTIESHFDSNIPFTVEQAAEEVSEIQENAKTQLSLFVSKSLGASLSPADLTPLLEGVSQKLISSGAFPVLESYTPKEREAKPIDQMTAMELGDSINKELNRLESLKSFQENSKNKVERGHLYYAGARGSAKGVQIGYISYQGNHLCPLDKARRYLKFLLNVKTPEEFETHWHFEPEGK